MGTLDQNRTSKNFNPGLRDYQPTDFAESKRFRLGGLVSPAGSRATVQPAFVPGALGPQLGLQASLTVPDALGRTARAYPGTMASAWGRAPRAPGLFASAMPPAQPMFGDIGDAGISTLPGSGNFFNAPGISTPPARLRPGRFAFGASASPRRSGSLAF